jgi:hypothetical protein
VLQKTRTLVTARNKLPCARDLPLHYCITASLITGFVNHWITGSGGL